MIGRVYRINVNENDFYIGSTIKKLNDRQSQHNIRLKENIRKNKLYETCRLHNITKISLILIEEQEIEDIKEIRQLENKYIKELQPSLNCYIAYTELTREEYNKEYYDKNKEYHKEYNKENKSKLKEYHKKYWQNNKDKISERQTEKITCDICNSIVSRINILRHKKSIKCRSSIECFIQDE